MGAPPYRFTGKEEDVEVGLQYFGKRFYAPQLGRWVSADPLAVHGLGADLNVYAYVHGRVLSATDPLGLQEAPDASAPPPDAATREAKSGAFEATKDGAGDGATPIPGGAAPMQDAMEGKQEFETNGAQNAWARHGTLSGVKEGIHDWMFDSLPAQTYRAISVATGYGEPFARYDHSADTALSSNVRDATPLVIDTALSALGGAAMESGGAVRPAAPKLTMEPIAPPTSSGGSGAIVKYDGEFAAGQILGEEPVTPGGRTINAHAADRMVNPPKGRAPMSKAEIDQVLDTGDRIRKVTPHPEGDTITVQSTKMPGKPQVVVDAATGTRVITIIKQAR